ncbi:MAG: hypothetical protein ACPKOI_05765 [Pleomorphochaeta sp.]
MTKKTTAEVLLPIEDLGKKTDPAIFAAVCTMKNWNKGKKVSEEEFKKAVDKFNGAAVGETPIKEK